jgi:hypothetical protein
MQLNRAVTTENKPSRADAAHIAAAEYRREQNAGLERMARLKAARLAQARTEPPKPKRKSKTVRHIKTKNFGRWS